MLTTRVTTTQSTPFNFDRASHYYMMQQQTATFKLPITFPSKEDTGKTIKKNLTTLIIQQHLKTFEYLNLRTITWFRRGMLKQSLGN